MRLTVCVRCYKLEENKALWNVLAIFVHLVAVIKIYFFIKRRAYHSDRWKGRSEGEVPFGHLLEVLAKVRGERSINFYLIIVVCYTVQHMLLASGVKQSVMSICLSMSVLQNFLLAGDRFRGHINNNKQWHKKAVRVQYLIEVMAVLFAIVSNIIHICLV